MKLAFGHLTEAQTLYERAVRIREATLGPDHSDVAESLTGLALVYRSQGHFEQAEPLYKRALQIKEKTLGPNHEGLASTLT